jgi:Undecaprenyl-phosphate glucose phosphotransferase
MKQVILIADREELVRSDAIHPIRCAGYFPAVTLTYEPRPSAASLHDLAEEAIRVTRQRPIDSIMLIANWNDAGAIDHVVDALRVLPLSIHLLPDQRTAHLLKAGWSVIAGLTAAEVQRAPLSKAERAVKRMFDVLLAAGGLVLLSPLFAVVALLIKAETRGPIFFRQTRIGFNGCPFRIWKFRTMNVMENDTEFRQATRDDPRVTQLGRWLRKTSIDELPQLWNVMIGDMSIVGPRPHPTALDRGYQARIGSYAFRHHVKPGLTGWAQVHGFRGETATLDRMQGRVDHDLHYINHWSILLDMLIVLFTVRIVFRDPRAF